jgi:hypothetical protein
MKSDSQADELAEQATLLPTERGLLANKSRPTGSASLCFSSSSSAGRAFRQSRRVSTQSVFVSLALILPLVTRMFVQGLLVRRLCAPAG